MNSTIFYKRTPSGFFTLDNFFTVVIIPPVLVWAILFGISAVKIGGADRFGMLRRFSLVTSTLLFGFLFAIFAFLNLESPLNYLFYFISAMMIFYSFVIYASGEQYWRA